MRAGEICTICAKGKLVLLSQSEGGAQYRCDTCGGYHADAYGYANVASSPTELDSKSAKMVRRKPPKQSIAPAKEIRHTIKESSQVRYVYDRNGNDTVVFQIAYNPSGRVKHVDCKKCGNKWYLADELDIKDYFLMTVDKVQCVKCGAETEMSSV